MSFNDIASRCKSHDFTSLTCIVSDVARLRTIFLINVLRFCNRSRTILCFVSVLSSQRNLASSWASGIVRFAAIAMPGEEGTYTRLSLGNPILASNHKIKRDLSVTFRDPMVSLHDAIEDLVKWGHISLPRV